MKAMRLTQQSKGASFVSFEKPDAAPGPNQVAIRLHAAGLNAADTKIREGFGPPPDVMGFDAAGVVVATGPGATKFAVGDEVYGCVGGLPGHDGAFSQRMLADERLLAKKPASLSFRETAALPLAVITAWEALVERARVLPGDTVLVHGGTGGVGHFGIQLAKAMGATVHTTVSSPAKAEIARQLGADETINYRDYAVADYVKTFTGGRGYDVVFDTIGGNNLEASIAALATQGRLATIVPGSGLDISAMIFKNATLHVVLMLIPLMTGQDMERHGKLLERVATLVDQGRIKPLIDEPRFTLDDVGAALDRLESGQAIGKIVIDIA